MWLFVYGMCRLYLSMLGVCSGCLCTMCASMTYGVCCTWCVHVVVCMCLCVCAHMCIYVVLVWYIGLCSVCMLGVCAAYINAVCLWFVLCCVCVQAFAYVYLMEVSRQESNQFPIQAKETLLM